MVKWNMNYVEMHVCTIVVYAYIYGRFYSSFMFHFDRTVFIELQFTLDSLLEQKFLASN